MRCRVGVVWRMLGTLPTKGRAWQGIVDVKDLTDGGQRGARENG